MKLKIIAQWPIHSIAYQVCIDDGPSFDIAEEDFRVGTRNDEINRQTEYEVELKGYKLVKEDSTMEDDTIEDDEHNPEAQLCNEILNSKLDFLCYLSMAQMQASARYMDFKGRNRMRATLKERQDKMQARIKCATERYAQRRNYDKKQKTRS